MPTMCTPRGPRCAIIDIGSNSIRLVVYATGRRVPATLINEKVSARLGRTLQVDGRLPESAIDVALRGLARFRAIALAARCSPICVVATAAVRDAINGHEFLKRVRELGLAPQLLSGAEEAAASAQGVLCAFPGAAGLVADLGGGSLELVEVANGQPGAGVTLPLGTLRLATMREKNTSRALQRMRFLVEAAAPARLGEGRPLYIVGGSWRALAQFAMHEISWPIPSPHAFMLEPDRIAHLVSVLSHTPVSGIRSAGVSSARASSISDAALVLSALVRHLRPSTIVVSSFGLREGLAFASMQPELCGNDPLSADLEDRFGDAAPGSIYGPALHRWASAVFKGESPAESRARLAASWLGLAAREPEKPVRRTRALELALHEKWIGVDAADRARIAAALLAFVGEKDLPADVRRLAPPQDLGRAMCWGSVMRLAEKVSAGLAGVLESTQLRRVDGKLELILSDYAIYGGAVEQQHVATAAALGLAAEALHASQEHDRQRSKMSPLIV